jgi:hypothetical protein
MITIFKAALRWAEGRSKPYTGLMVGAVLLGLEALGTVVDDQIKQNIEESSREHNLVRLGEKIQG